SPLASTRARVVRHAGLAVAARQPRGRPGARTGLAPSLPRSARAAVPAERAASTVGAPQARAARGHARPSAGRGARTPQDALGRQCPPPGLVRRGLAAARRPGCPRALARSRQAAAAATRRRPRATDRGSCAGPLGGLIAYSLR